MQWALVIRLISGVLSLLCCRRARLVRIVAYTGSALASVVSASAAIGVLRGGTAARAVYVHRASALSFSLAIDPLSAWFLLVLAVVAGPIALFSVGYTAHLADRRSTFVALGYNLLLAAVELVFVASDAVTFLFAWELMTLSTAALVVTDHEIAATRRAAFLYLTMSHVGTGCLFAAFLTLGAHAGSLTFQALLAGSLVSGPLRTVVFALFLTGFGIKAGIIPLHVWLPEAHPAAPTSISALMSGVLIKTGIYGIIRFAALGLGTPDLAWGVTIVVAGGVAALLGVLYALMQHDLKRLLAYHSIENVGIILLGVGAGMVAMAGGNAALAAAGLAAALYHVLNHAVFKGLLFLGAGGVALSTGTRHIEHLGGLQRRMPWTAGFFLVGALAISGVPPLNGFASEWLTFQAFLYGFHTTAQPLVLVLFPVAGGLLALTTALAAACFVKAFAMTFLALPRSAEASGASESPRTMLVPQAVLAALCVLLGVLPGTVLRVLGRVVTAASAVTPAVSLAGGATVAVSPGSVVFDQLVPLALGVALVAGLGLSALVVGRVVIRRAPTWGCGGTLGPRTEYTATAFSKPLMMIFRAIYRPTRRVEAAEVSPYFTTEVRYQAQIEPTFERYLYEPMMRGVMRVAERMKMLQAGSLHAYLGYVIALVLTLVLIVWWTG